MGSIPAWAGKPAASYPKDEWYRVHPRVGGETAGGTNDGHNLQGPSPRGRGNLSGQLEKVSDSRSIPAWAGKPAACRRC